MKECSEETCNDWDEICYNGNSEGCLDWELNDSHFYDWPLRRNESAKNPYIHINYKRGKAPVVRLHFIEAFMVNQDLESIEATHIVADDSVPRTMLPWASNITSLSFRESTIPPASMKRLLSPIRALRKFTYNWSTDIPDLKDMLHQYCGRTLEDISLQPRKPWVLDFDERVHSPLGSLRGFSMLKTLHTSCRVAAGSTENLKSRSSLKTRFRRLPFRQN